MALVNAIGLDCDLTVALEWKNLKRLTDISCTTLLEFVTLITDSIESSMACIFDFKNNSLCNRKHSVCGLYIALVW